MESKPAVSSMSLWGSGSVILASILSALSEVAQTGQLPAEYLPYVGAIGGAVAFIGRLIAKKKILGAVR